MTTAHDIDHRQLVEGRLTSASPDLLRERLTMFVHALRGAEADALCGAGYGQRSDERVNVRNGYRHRDFDTRVGTLDVAIPELRQGSNFSDSSARSACQVPPTKPLPSEANSPEPFVRMS